eukprot:g4037.t1
MMLLSVLLGGIILFIVIYLRIGNLWKGNNHNPVKNDGAVSSKKKRRKKKKTQNRFKQLSVGQAKLTKKKMPSSDLLLFSLKGARDVLTDASWSMDGKIVATSSKDGGLRIFSIKELREKTNQMHHVQLKFDYFSSISLNSDGTAIVCAQEATKKLLFYSVPRFSKKKTGNKPVHQSSFDIETGHQSSIRAVIFADTGIRPIISTVTEKRLKFWSKKGNCLSSQNPGTGENYGLSHSSDSLNFCTSNWTPEAKIYSVERNRKGVVEKFSQDLSLVGHKGSVLSTAFGFFPNGTFHVVTGSNDGCFRLFDVEHPYENGKIGKSAKLIQRVEVVSLEEDKSPAVKAVVAAWIGAKEIQRGLMEIVKSGSLDKNDLTTRGLDFGIAQIEWAKLLVSEERPSLNDVLTSAVFVFKNYGWTGNALDLVKEVAEEEYTRTSPGSRDGSEAQALIDCGCKFSYNFDLDKTTDLAYESPDKTVPSLKYCLIGDLDMGTVEDDRSKGLLNEQENKDRSARQEEKELEAELEAKRKELKVGKNDSEEEKKRKDDGLKAFTAEVEKRKKAKEDEKKMEEIEKLQIKGGIYHAVSHLSLHHANELKYIVRHGDPFRKDLGLNVLSQEGMTLSDLKIDAEASLKIALEIRAELCDENKKVNHLTRIMEMLEERISQREKTMMQSIKELGAKGMYGLREKFLDKKKKLFKTFSKEGRHEMKEKWKAKKENLKKTFSKDGIKDAIDKVTVQNLKGAVKSFANGTVNAAKGASKIARSAVGTTLQAGQSLKNSWDQRTARNERQAALKATKIE